MCLFVIPQTGKGVVSIISVRDGLTLHETLDLTSPRPAVRHVFFSAARPARMKSVKKKQLASMGTNHSRDVWLDRGGALCQSSRAPHAPLPPPSSHSAR